VQQAIEKANTLIEALAWIRQFRDKTTVIKLGGSMLSDPEAIQHILLDILFMESVGMRPVVVHGAGSPSSGFWLKRLTKNSRRPLKKSVVVR